MKPSMKPKWIDQVKEITVEEASLLYDLGVQIYGDFSDECASFYSSPDWDKSKARAICRRRSAWTKNLFRKARDRGSRVVFYLPKEDTDE